MRKERNHKSILIEDKWYVKIEYYRSYDNKWIKTIFTDWNADRLAFLSKEDADNWISMRKDILSIEL